MTFKDFLIKKEEKLNEDFTNHEIVVSVPKKYDGDIKKAYKNNELRIVKNANSLSVEEFNKSQVRKGVDFVRTHKKVLDDYKINLNKLSSF